MTQGYLLCNKHWKLASAEPFQRRMSFLGATRTSTHPSVSDWQLWKCTVRTDLSWHNR